jgi:hypothetical protein
MSVTPRASAIRSRAGAICGCASDRIGDAASARAPLIELCSGVGKG